MELANTTVNAKTACHLQVNLDQEIELGDDFKLQLPQGFQLLDEIKCFSGEMECCYDLQIQSDGRSFICHGVRVAIKAYQNQEVLITGVVNPSYSGSFFGGYLKIMKQSQRNHFEIMRFMNAVLIQPSNLVIKLNQTNTFTERESHYNFEMESPDQLGSLDQIRITFPKEFLLLNTDCFAIVLEIAQG